MKVHEEPYHQLPKPITESRVSFTPQPQLEQAATEAQVQLDLETPSSEKGRAPFRQLMKDWIHSTYYQVTIQRGNILNLACCHKSRKNTFSISSKYVASF